VGRLFAPLMSKGLVGSTLLAICIVSLCIVLIEERWTTPASELKMTLGFCKQLEAMERVYLQKYGKYGGLRELLDFSAPTIRSTIDAPCRCGYCFDVEANGREYSIRIRPDIATGRFARRRALSLYSDETRTVRASYGLPRADKHSSILSPAELMRFMR
jgi:hypothetical protein